MIARGVRRILGKETETVTTPSTPLAHGYSRQDMARILGIPEKQIVKWQRDGLIVEADSYTFADLSHLRYLRELQATRLSARSIRNSVAAMQKVAGMRNPLRETRAERRGSRLVFRHGGALLDPQTDQFAFDFGTAAASAGLALVKAGQTMQRGEAEQQGRAQELFLHAVQLEDDPDTIPMAAEKYLEALELNPRHAAASINLGTIFYNQRNYEEAEARYRYATEVDPDYALAFFDLGNVLDELQRLPEAIAAYARAIALVPDYADAHYNLALAYERCGKRRQALRYWISYVKMDPVGPWAAHARSQAKRILASEKLKVVCRGGKLAG